MKPLSHFLLWSLGLARPTTQTSDTERACLARYATGRRRVAEVGVWHGVTTTVLLTAMDPGGTLFAIDPFPRGRLGVSFPKRIARGMVGRCRRARVVWLEMTGYEAAHHVVQKRLESFDFVFLDGDHSYEATLADWESWSPLIAPAGVILLHDSRSSETCLIDDAGSARVTREIIVRDPRFEVVDAVETLTVLRRKENA